MWTAWLKKSGEKTAHQLAEIVPLSCGNGKEQFSQGFGK
jgi:hypothetical protein